MPSQPVQRLSAEVARLRAEGLSFSRIAKKLAISKSYAVKLSQSDRSLDSATGHRNGHSRSLTVRQRRFAAELAQGKSQRQAAVAAGCSPGGADDFAQRTLKNPQFQEAFDQLLDRMGLSDQRIAEGHAENLQATKVVAVARNTRGQITEVRTAPDHATRQRAVADAWRVRGRLGTLADQDGDRGQPLQINILYATAQKVERLVGRKIIPDEWEEMVRNGDQRGGAIRAVLPGAPGAQEAQPAVAEPPSESPESCQAEELDEDNPIAAEW